MFSIHGTGLGGGIVVGRAVVLESRLTEDMPAEAQALLQVHAMILEDPTLLEGASEAITQHGRNAEWAFAA